MKATPLGLLAGLLLLDVLLNLPGFSAAARVASLLAPSIDLLVIGALLAGARQAGAGKPAPGGRAELRIVACVVLVVFAACRIGLRFGFDIGFRWLGQGTPGGVAASSALSLVIVAAGALLSWIASGLVVRAFSEPLVRSLFIVTVAASAVLHVLLGNRVFTPSVVPRIARDILAAF